LTASQAVQVEKKREENRMQTKMIWRKSKANKKIFRKKVNPEKIE